MQQQQQQSGEQRTIYFSIYSKLFEVLLSSNRFYVELFRDFLHLTDRENVFQHLQRINDVEFNRYLIEKKRSLNLTIQFTFKETLIRPYGSNGPFIYLSECPIEVYMSVYILVSQFCSKTKVYSNVDDREQQQQGQQQQDDRGGFSGFYGSQYFNQLFFEKESTLIRRSTDVLNDIAQFNATTVIIKNLNDLSLE